MQGGRTTHEILIIPSLFTKAYNPLGYVYLITAKLLRGLIASKQGMQISKKDPPH